MLHEPLRAVGRQSTLLHAVQHGGVSCMGVTNLCCREPLLGLTQGQPMASVPQHKPRTQGRGGVMGLCCGTEAIGWPWVSPSSTSYGIMEPV